jgi:hypothetical protein
MVRPVAIAFLKAINGRRGVARPWGKIPSRRRRWRSISIFVSRGPRRVRVATAMARPI